MSTLTKVLERNIKVIEKNADLTEGRFRLGHHLMPPVGWLNDPNGLCWYKGRYHVFFQYAPFDVEGGLKFWGHYTSEDLVDWKYEGTALIRILLMTVMEFIPVLRWWMKINCIFSTLEMLRSMVTMIISTQEERQVHFMW